jgi:hypothetical protein
MRLVALWVVAAGHPSRVALVLFSEAVAGVPLAATAVVGLSLAHPSPATRATARASRR